MTNKEDQHVFGVYSTLNDLKRNFDMALDEGDLQKALLLKIRLQRDLNFFRANLVFGGAEFENPQNLFRQYKSNIEALLNAGVLEETIASDYMYKAANGLRFPVPHFEEIVFEILDKIELVRKKASQGFKKLLLVPFGMNVADLHKLYVDELKLQSQTGELLDYENNRFELLDVQRAEGQELEVRKLDNPNTIFYYPKELTENHQGKSKQQVLSNLNMGPFPGWNVLLIEDMPILPLQGEEKTAVDRKQFLTYNTPEEHLTNLNSIPQYEGEVPMTPEDYLAYAILQLHQAHTPLDLRPHPFEVGCISLGSVRVPTIGQFSGIGVPIFDWFYSPVVELNSPTVSRRYNTRSAIKLN